MIQKSLSYHLCVCTRSRQQMRFRKAASMDLRDCSPKSTRMSSQISNLDENSVNLPKGSISELVGECNKKNREEESKLSERAPESPFKPNSSQASASLQNSPINEATTSEIETSSSKGDGGKRKEKESAGVKRIRKFGRSKSSAGKQISAVSRTDSIGVHDDQQAQRANHSADHVKAPDNRHESSSASKKRKTCPWVCTEREKKDKGEGERVVVIGGYVVNQKQILN